MFYIIKTGIVFYGIIFFFLGVFLSPFIDYNFTFDFMYKETFKTRLIVFIIVAPIFGIIIAYLNWNGLKKKYGE